MSYIAPSDVELVVEDVIEDVDQPLAYEACRTVSRTGLNNRIGYKDLKTELKSGDLNKDVPPGSSSHREEEVNYSEVAYLAKKQSGFGFIPDEARAQMEGYERDAVEDALDEAVTEARFTVDHKLADFLENSSGMGTLTQNNGTWDSTSSTPYLDMRESARETVDADTIILGQKVVEELRQHPDTKEFGDVDGQRSGYSGDAQAPVDYTIEKVRQSYKSIENVYVFDTPYDTAALGLSPSVSRLYDKRAAVCHKSRLMCVDPDAEVNPNTRTDDDIDRAAMKVRHDVYVDFLHPIDTLGQEDEVVA